MIQSLSIMELRALVDALVRTQWNVLPPEELATSLCDILLRIVDELEHIDRRELRK